MGSVIIIATLKIKEGKMEEAIAALKEVVPEVLKVEPGTLVYSPMTVRGEGNQNTIIYYEKYESVDAMKIHMGNLPKYSAKLGPLLDGPADIKSCNAIIE